jgi:hypothetical protein
MTQIWSGDIAPLAAQEALSGEASFSNQFPLDQVERFRNLAIFRDRGLAVNKQPVCTK